MKSFTMLFVRFLAMGVICGFADVFDAGNGVPANFTDGTIAVTVNGSKKGNKTVQPGETLGAFLKRQAQTYGVRTFSAFADGRKLDTTDAAKAVEGIKEIEITAKDSRGHKLTMRSKGKCIFHIDAL